MAFNVKNKKGNIKAKQTIANSEVEPEAIDFSVENEEGDIDAEQNLSGVKSRKGWIVIVLAVIGLIGTLITLYFKSK